MLPDVPTFAEAGLPEFSAGNWYSIVGPKGIARPIVDKVAADLRKVVSVPKFEEVLESEGMDVFLNTPEQFAVLLKADSERYRRIVESMQKQGIKSGT